MQKSLQHGERRSRCGWCAREISDLKREIESARKEIKIKSFAWDAMAWMHMRDKHEIFIEGIVSS